MKILLTGAAGFIGSHVARHLLADAHEVVGIDNLNDAYDVRLKEWRLEQLRASRGFSFSLCDISDFSALKERWERSGPFDAVVDLAARAGVRASIDDPWVYLSTNAAGTVNLLELCRRSDTRKVVLASSSSVYGKSAELPYTEDQRVDTPVSPYAASKIAAEVFAHSYHHLYGLDISVLRYFTVYGPAGRPDMSPFRFIRWISEESPVTIFGDGTQSRDYTYVDDIARGTVSALRPVGYSVINLGSDAPVTLMDMARIVEELVGKQAHFVYRPASDADVKATWARIDRAKHLLNWTPKTSLREGLSACVDWYRSHRDLASVIRL